MNHSLLTLLTLAPLLTLRAADPPPRITLADLTLPTVNDALFREGGEAEFFQSTVAGDWRSGQYGCVRSSGAQFHEGLDVRCVARDRRGEPLDEVRATAAGTLVYINNHAGKSTYGRYVVVQHNIDGAELFSLYAHLNDVADDLKTGASIQKGQRLGTLGYTGAGITRDRAHLHFELNFMVNPNFNAWYRKNYPPSDPNDHGLFNGQNLIGLDPAALFKASRENPKLTLPDYLRARPEAFRALVPAKNFRWLDRNGWMLNNQPTAISDQLSVQSLQPSAFEISFDPLGIPREVIAHSDTDLTDAQRRTLARNLPILLLVDETELARCRCRSLVTKGRRSWQFTNDGFKWIELMTY